MKTPERVTWEEFSNAISLWLETRTERTDAGVVCRACDKLIQFVQAPLSVHFSDFTGCAGGGTVFNAFIPFCPRCEPTPGAGCLHLPYVPSPAMQRAKAAAAPPARILIEVTRQAVRTPDRDRAVTMYRVRDPETTEDVAIKEAFMNAMVSLIHYLERKLHGG